MRDVAIFRHQLFLPSEPFIQQQAEHLAEFHPVYVGRTRHGEPPDGAESCALEDLLEFRSFHRRLRQVMTHSVRPYERLLKGRTISLVHAHFGVEGVYALPLARALNVPLVTTFHGFDATTSKSALLTSRKPSWVYYALLRSRLADRGDLFICVSDFIRERVLALGFPEEKTITHYIGIETDAPDSPKPRSEHPTVLHVARLVEKKGTEYLLEAFSRVNRKMPEAELVIIGDGPLRQDLVARTERLKISHRVRFLGSKPHAEVLEHMEQAWVFCLPSVTARSGDSEGLAMVFLEAGIREVPVVGTLHAGIPEAVRSGETGHLVRERDPVALYEALLELLEDPSRRRQMGQAGRRIVEANFDLGVQSAKLDSIYGELVARHH